MKSFNLSAWAVGHRSLVLFMILAVAAGGALSFLRLGRAEDPNFTIKVAIVTASWPGATAREMQDQVADRIEKKFQELPYFDKVTTYAKPGFAALQVAFRDSTPPGAIPVLFYQLRKKLDDLKGQLPTGLTALDVDDEYGDVDALLYMLSGSGVDYAQMKRVAEGLRQRLLKVDGVAKVDLYGLQDERIFVEFSHAKLATLGITPSTLFDALARQNAVAPAGFVETGAQRVPLRVTGALDGARAVAEAPIEAEGRTFRLGDVATVTRGFVDPPDSPVRQMGKEALGIGVVMAKGANISAFGASVGAAKSESMASVPQGIDLEQVADQPKVVEDAMNEFERSFIEALVIVLAVSFLSLGWRTGIVVALSVPLVLAICFAVMAALGIDLHRITLGALIIALGLLVDDAIIAVEMMVVKMEQGWPRTRAAAFAWESTAFPMLTGTLVTVAGFLPVGFAQSSVGEYAGGIFTVVAIALVASWLVAVIFTPYLGVLLLPGSLAKGGKHADEEAIYRTKPYRALRACIAFCVRRRGVVTMATVAVFAGAVVGFGHVQQQFFATYTAYVGRGSPRFWLGLNPQLPNQAFAEIVIVARDAEARERVKAHLERAVAEGALPQARVRVDRFNFGPPVGFPVQFRVIGPDPLQVRDIAYRVRDVMRGNAALIDPNLDWNELTPSVRLVVDQERARLLGLNVADVAQTLQLELSGTTVTTVRDGTEQVAVVARATEAERLDLGHVGDLTIVSRNGVPVPVSQVARLDYAHEEPILWRRNRDMAITVRADVVDGVQPPDVTNAVWPALKPIHDGLAPAYRIEIGGAVEESAKANASLFALFPIMGLAMLTLLMIQLQSFGRMLLVFLTAPLGIIGASLALNLTGKPFGFVALLGLIALAGMIMRNAVILVDQIERDVASGHARLDAIVDATVRRARPVVLTALAAILAMIPLSRSAFWGPMAVTIMGGLFVATFLTLFTLPAVYALVFGRDATSRAAARRSTGDRPEAGAAHPLPAE